jgi:hypothetical protein
MAITRSATPEEIQAINLAMSASFESQDWAAKSCFVLEGASDPSDDMAKLTSYREKADLADQAMWNAIKSRR